MFINRLATQWPTRPVNLKNSFKEVPMAVELFDSMKQKIVVPVVVDAIITAPVSVKEETVEGQTPERKLKLRPLGDRVLVRVLPQKDEPENGIWKPDEAKEKPQEGIVVAVGKGRIKDGERVPVDVSVGELVTFGKYSGNEIKVLGEKLLLLQENEIMGEYYAE
jgi:chaperonin GroES